MKSSRLFHWTASLILASLCLGGSVEAASKKLLVVTVTKGFRHSSIPTAESVLGALATGSSHFEVDYARTDEEIAEKMNPQALQQWDGVVFANTTGDLPIPNREYFLEWLQSGKAFIGMLQFRHLSWLPQVCRYDRRRVLDHGPQVEVTARVEDRHHPACQHYGESFQVYDEIYISEFPSGSVHGLLPGQAPQHLGSRRLPLPGAVSMDPARCSIPPWATARTSGRAIIIKASWVESTGLWDWPKGMEALQCL